MRSSQLFSFLAVNTGVAYSLALSYPRDSDHDRTSAAYFQANDPAGNSIVSLQISNSDGTLSNPVRTSTGGKGLDGLIAISQDSVVVDGNYLFTTNAGDNTFSLFTVDINNPQHLELAGKPLPTLGQTPVSVAYSDALKTACVLNSGSTAGVICFNISPSGPTPQGGLRFIPQTENSDPTPPPPGPLVIGDDILFNPSSTALFATIRSNGAQAGLIYAFPITDGKISTTPVVSSFPTIPFIFSLNFLDNSDSHLFVTNPHLDEPGAAFVTVSYPDLKITLTENITIPEQIASCWTAYTPRHDTIFVIDAARPTITAVNPESGEVLGQVNFTTTAAQGSGGFDSKVAGDWLYTLTDDQTDPKIEVLQIVGRQQILKQVQSFDIFQEVGKIPGWMGMAVYHTG